MTEVAEGVGAIDRTHKVHHADTDTLSVLFVVDSTFPGLGGAEIQALKLARALREAGVTVEFLAPRVLAEQSVQETLDGFPVQRIDYPHIRLFGSAVLLLKFAWQLFQLRHRYRCIHVHVTRLLAAMAAVVGVFTDVPVITKISGFFEFEGGVLDHRRRWYPLNLLTRLALRRVSFVQTISVQTREKLHRAGFADHQIRFIPNGIDTRENPPSLSLRGTLMLGYCGRLREVKGVHVLIEALGVLLARRPDADIHLQIAGDGETHEALLKQVATLGLKHRVTFLGRIDDTTDFFASTTVYVQPSFAEGLPNSVMEAMLAARPVLATDIGGNRDLVETGQTGLLFPAGNAEALARLIERCLDDRDSLSELGQQGRELITRQFGFDRVVAELIEVYRG